MDDRHFADLEGETIPSRTRIEEVEDGCSREHARTQDESDIGALGTSSLSTLLEPRAGRMTSSNSSPPQDDGIGMDFAVPARPKSTPFPYPEHQRRTEECPYSDAPGQDMDIMDVTMSSAASDTTLIEPADVSVPGILLTELPVEIQEAILDHIFGSRVSRSSRSSMKVSSYKTDDYRAMRHCRRRELTELALLSHTWRILIQQRLYRHIKLKGTVAFLEEASDHFLRYEHLREHVKHIEVWFPVFQPTYTPSTPWGGPSLIPITSDGITNHMYRLPGTNCSLEQVFFFIACNLPKVRVLTLEGGERRKAPMVTHFDSPEGCSVPSRRFLTTIPTITTLVTKGQWNLMRQIEDFSNIFVALPNVHAWHGSYSRPKSKLYITMAEFLPHMPLHISDLKLHLETDYRREPVQPMFFTKAAEHTHLCTVIGENSLSLEHFSYTGRICHNFFEFLTVAHRGQDSKLKSIDLTVKNCCRPRAKWNESGSGLQDMSFIDAFEKLVVAAVRALAVLDQLEYLRIRFVDIDSQESTLPPLNPYFLLRDGICEGVWSEKIIQEMSSSRPEVTFVELSHSFGTITYNKERRLVVLPDSNSRPNSLKIENYKLLAPRFTIQ